MNYNDKTRFEALSEYLKIPFEDISVPEYSKRNRLLAKMDRGSIAYIVLTEKETKEVVVNKFLDEILVGEVDQSFFDLKIKYNVQHLSSSEVDELYRLSSHLTGKKESQVHTFWKLFWKLLTGKNDLNKLGLDYYKYLIQNDGRELSIFLESKSGVCYFDYKRKMWLFEDLL